jgi:REP element-mobilizing transposase RayT
MPIRKTIQEKDGVYFITFTCARWLPLFKIVDSYNSVYRWFDILKKAGHYIIGFVIMPSHIHAIIAFNLNIFVFHLPD